MWRTLPLVAGTVLTVGFGIGEGLWTGRWVPSSEMQAAVARLQEVPVDVGEWKGEPLAVDEQEIAKSGTRGYVSRRYVHQRTGKALSILLVCGPPGPVSVHSPEVCYPSSGYAMAPPVRQTVKSEGLGQPAEFCVARFQKEDAASPDPLRIHWAWTGTGKWQAPDNPRFTFARYRVLYKLYIVRGMSGLNEPGDADPSAEFLKAFLPELQKSLFAHGKE